MHGMWFSTGLALGPQGTDSWAGPGWASVSQTPQCRPEAQKDRVQKHQGVSAGHHERGAVWAKAQHRSRLQTCILGGHSS